MQPSLDPCGELSQFMRRPTTEEDLARLLKAVLTPAEIESISQRLCILDGIATGVPQREIAESLRVGIATVTRGSRVWQENRDDLGVYFPRHSGLSHLKSHASAVGSFRGSQGIGTALPPA
jgi:TrpR family transcriptional regulator, trp operon repressor